MQEYIKSSSASKLELFKLSIYYCQRICTSRTLRRAANYLLILGLGLRYGNPRVLGGKRHKDALVLRERGIVRVANILNENQCASIREYLSSEEFFDNRGSGRSLKFANVDQSCRFGDFPLDTVVNCPHVMEIANDPEIIRLVSSRLGFAPTITGLSIRWSFPNSTGADEVQRFHRDCEIGSLKLIIYLTDVDDSCGPHVYLDGSHEDKIPLRLRSCSDEEAYDSHGRASEVTGRAGTSFAIDTKGLHKGGIPSSRPRLILGIQYALLPCYLFRYIPAKYTGHAHLEPYPNRLIVQSEVCN